METSFIIDLASVHDLATKHREAQEILETKKRELQALRDIERQVERWQSVVAFLATQIAELEAAAELGRAALDQSQNESNAAAPSQPGVGDLVVEVVNRELREIRARQVRETLNAEGHDFTGEQISNALHYAAHGAKRIQAARGRGMYAPLAYREPQLPDPAEGQSQAQPLDAAAPGREDWSGPRHPATPMYGGGGGPVKLAV